MWIKICGITTLDDARMCLEAGADSVGLNLVGGPRRLTLDAALDIAAGAGPERVVIFARAEEFAQQPFVDRLLGSKCLTVQMYGAQKPADVTAIVELGFQVIYVHPVSESQGLSSLAAQMASRPQRHIPHYVLLDAHVPGKQGGTGVPLDWELVSKYVDADGCMEGVRLILAGGLQPTNVAHAVRLARPWGVDVSSGVEFSPGRKDPEKVRQFIAEARTAKP